MSKKILIIGCGHVGGTIATIMEDFGNDIVRIDPKLNDNKIESYKLFAEGAVICLPTPTVNGKCDDSLIHETVQELGPNIKVLIKSTVLPNLLEKYPDNVSYSPEFLREEHAIEDYKNQKYVIWGGTRLQVGWWMTKFPDLTKQNIVTTRGTASVVKYVYNCWLATKVAFFHELFSKLDKSYNYTQMISILSHFENIGPSHMKVPRLGYDGNCFPKDMEAFAEFTDSEILKKVIEVNENLIGAR